MPRSLTVLMLVVAATFLHGCTDSSALTPAEAAEWRIGWVHQIIDGRHLKNPQQLVCVSMLSPDRIADNQFAEIWYVAGRARGSITIPVPESLQLKVEDEVRINTRACTLSVSRMKK